MEPWKSRILVSLIVVGWQVSAHQPEDGDIHLTLAPLLAFTPAWHHSASGPLGGGGGVLVEGDLNRHGGVEISALMSRPRFTRGEDGSLVTEAVTRLSVATGYRHWFTTRFSAAIQFDSSFSMGEPDRVRDDFGRRDAPPTSAQQSVIHGIDVSTQWEPLVRDRLSVVLEARAFYALTAQESEDANVVMVLAGVKYFLQSRTEKLSGNP